MAVTGGIKFFNKNKMAEGATVASSGTSSSKFILDLDVDTYWTSLGSSDGISEEITITTTKSQTIDRILLLDHNFKTFNVKYYDGSSYVDFANVIGIGGTTSSTINETSFSQDSAYYEFTQVSTTSIKITVSHTQIPNQDKYLNQAIASTEIGTFAGYPEVSSVTIDRNSKVKKTLGGRFSVQKGNKTFGYDIKFKNYPSSDLYNVDIDLAISLFETEDPFIIYACGGRYESQHFKKAIPGFRLKDAFLVQIQKTYKLKYLKNIYVNPIDLGGLKLVSSIG